MTMHPDRAATLFRELLLTPEGELHLFARRAGLHNRPSTAELQQARELLQTLAQAIVSEPGPNWGRVGAAWTGMRAMYGALGAMGGPPPTTSASPAPPGWVRDLPKPPSLGDLAPGVQAPPEPREPQRFVPVAPPQFVPMPRPDYAPPAAVPLEIEPEPVSVQPLAPPGPPPRRPPPPRQAPSAPLPTELTSNVSSYASFCAACAGSPQHAAETQRSYGIADEAARRALDAVWQDRFDEDPALLAQWEKLFQQFREQLRRRR